MQGAALHPPNFLERKFGSKNFYKSKANPCLAGIDSKHRNTEIIIALWE